MSRERIERHLQDVCSRLAALREDLRITEEQLAPLADEAEDSRLRALVSETPLAEHEHREARRHADRLRRHRQGLLDRIEELESSQDALLDRLTASSARSSR